MAKAKRMSDVFASSAEKSSSAPAAAVTPYSSEGPTLPIIGGVEGEHAANAKEHADASKSDGKTHERGSRKSKAGEEQSERKVKHRAQPASTFDPALYEAWNLLPPELLRILISSERLRPKQNIVPIVFTKNQNIKTGVNRLKTYLGAYVDKHQPMDIPEALKQADAIIVISAQGEGTAKLVSIVDMVRRVVAPSNQDKAVDGKVETWCMYTSLTSIEVEHTVGHRQESNGDLKQGNKNERTAADDVEEEEEEEAFEPMEVDVPAPRQGIPQKQNRRDPVLTIWMTKKRIPALQKAFGEQTFEVQTLPQDD